MGDTFVECFVKRKTSKKALIMQALLILLIVLVFAVGLFVFMSKIFFLIGIVISFVCYKLSDSKDMEFEYVFTNGDLDFAQITNKSKRKELFSISMTDVEVMAPKNSDRIKRLISNPNIKYKKQDFSSGFSKNQDKVYEMVAKRGGEAYHILFEPNRKLLDAMKQSAPRNVFED